MSGMRRYDTAYWRNDQTHAHQPSHRNSGSGSSAQSGLLQPPHASMHTPRHADGEDDADSMKTAASVGDVSEPLRKVDHNAVGLGPADPYPRLARTPSPTPSELKELSTGAVNWREMRSWRFWFRREWFWYYVALVIIIVITVLVSVFHKQIVDWLTPAANWLHDTPGGWLVPIAVLFVISFPPLFGHEIVSMLIGLVWGFWIGFGIMAAGTLLGEIGNFYAFKYCCRSRGAKLERTNLSYACLAKVIRDGGFWIATVARLSAIPGHFTTAIFSTCGMGIIVFIIATLLSMPKQALGVYLGVMLKRAGDDDADKESSIVNTVVLVLTVVVTILAMWYILRQMNKVKPHVIYRRRKARQEKLSRPALPYPSPGLYTPSSIGSASTLAVDEPSKSESEDIQMSLMSRPPQFPPLEAPHPVRPVEFMDVRHVVGAVESRSVSVQYAAPTGPGEGATNMLQASRGPYSGVGRGGGGSMEEVGWDMGRREVVSPVERDDPYYRPNVQGTRSWV